MSVITLNVQSVYIGNYLPGVPDGSSGPPNFFFLGVVDFGRLVPMTQESGTGLGTILSSLSSSGMIGDDGSTILPLLSISIKLCR